MNKILKIILDFLKDLLKNAVFTTQTQGLDVEYNKGAVNIEVDFEVFTGCREDGQSHCPRFGTVGTINKKLLPPLYQFYQSRIMYNQLDTGKNDCTITAANTAWSNILNSLTSLSVRQEIKKEALAGGLDENKGRWLHKAVDLIRRRLGDVTSYEIRIQNTDELMAVLNKGYMVVTGFYGTRSFNQDVQADGVLNTVHGGKDWAHAVCLTRGPGKDGSTEYWMVDNYQGRNRYNVYKLPVLLEMIKANQFFKFGYYYVQK